LVCRPRSRPDVASSDGGRVARYPPAAHVEQARLGAAKVAATVGRASRRFFTAVHRSSDL